MSMKLIDVVSQVTRFTVSNPNERDCWEKAPAMTGILTWNEGRSVKIVSSWLDRAIATQKSDGNFSYTDASKNMLGHIRNQTPTASLPASIGYPLLLRYQREGNSVDLDAAARQIEGIRRSPRTSEGGIWARHEAPELWIDYLYLMCPFMVLFGKIAKDDNIVEDAVKQFDVHVKYLVDQHANLARHAWCERPNHFPQSTFWLRGNGWLVSACVDLISLFPTHPATERIRNVCEKVLNAMAAYQDRSGYFYHVLDDIQSNFEASGTLMYAYAVAKAVTLGIVGKEMLDSAFRAFIVVAGSVESSGKVPGVALAPGGPGVPFDWTLFGQGFFLLAAHALKQHLPDQFE